MQKGENIIIEIADVIDSDYKALIVELESKIDKDQAKQLIIVDRKDYSRSFRYR